MVGRYLTTTVLVAFAWCSTFDAAAQGRTETVALGNLMNAMRTIEVEVGGQPATFILDTGEGVSVLSPKVAERARCEPWGQIVGFRLTGERLSMPRCDGLAIKIGDRILKSPSAGAYDLDSLLPPDGPRIDGLLALDALASSPFTLELRTGRLTFETEESLKSRIENATEISVRPNRQAGGASLTLMARVTTGRGDLCMQLDSGSGKLLLLPPSSAEALDVATGGAARSPLTIAIVGPNGASIAVETQPRVRDMIIDGNIGIPVMMRWAITFDVARDRGWIQKPTCEQAPETDPSAC